jgi:DNA-binding NtrC family response regulator
VIAFETIATKHESVSINTEVRRYKLALIWAALDHCNGNQTAAARKLRMPRSSLLRLLGKQK